MRTADTFNAKGQVSPYFMDIRTGELIPWEKRHNAISYEASYAMASAFGGNLTYIPNRIGIIYGDGEYPEFGTIGRDQTWSDLHEELESKHADVQVVPFSFTPSLKDVYKGVHESSSSTAADDAEVLIPGHSITFHAHSDSVTPGAFDDKSSASQGGIFTTGNYIYQAVLLNKTGDAYRIIARASLDSNGVYYTKPENFEVAIDWTIKFF